MVINFSTFIFYFIFGLFSLYISVLFLYISDYSFFQPDWAGAYWGRWAGDRATAGLVCRFWMWHSSVKTREKERAGGGFARNRSDA